VTTVGILGAGKLGTVLARLAVAAGYRTLIAASGDPAAIRLVVDVMAPGAIATSAADAAREGDLVVLAVPLGRYRTLPTTQLAGKVVVDAMNYWPPTDGVLPEFEDAPSSPVVAAALPGARVVKALSHLDYHQLDEDARPPGAPDRHAAALAGDDEQAVQVAAELVDRMGFDPVVAGPLGAGARFGPGSRLFGVSASRADVEALLDAKGTTSPPDLSRPSSPRSRSADTASP
jgi:predicted dinucleotide-binding enzyme